MRFIKNIKLNYKFCGISFFLILLSLISYAGVKFYDITYDKYQIANNSDIEELSKNECLKNKMLNFINKENVIRNIDIDDFKYQCSPEFINRRKKMNDLYIPQNKFINDNIKK